MNERIERKVALFIAGKQIGIYNFVGIFHDGFVRVKQGNKFGFMNEKGEQICRCIYDSAYDFKDGLGGASRNGKFTVINRNGKEIGEDFYGDCCL